MEFDEEHDDPDEEMDMPDDHDHHHHPSSANSSPKPCSSSSSSAGVRYRECQKNQAVGIGGSAIDGCGEFMPAGEEGTLDALRCSACNCHRNFHRKETAADSLAGALIFQSPHHQYHHYGPPPHHQFSPYFRSGPAPSGYLQLTAAPSTQRQLALPSSGGPTSSREDVDDCALNNPGSGSRRSRSTNKRSRAKFTQEQRERMLVFAERLGWRMQKQDVVAVEQFCAVTGVHRQVLKVWMHNNRNTLGKKP